MFHCLVPLCLCVWIWQIASWLITTATNYRPHRCSCSPARGYLCSFFFCFTIFVRSFTLCATIIDNFVASLWQCSVHTQTDTVWVIVFLVVLTRDRVCAKLQINLKSSFRTFVHKKKAQLASTISGGDPLIQVFSSLLFLVFIWSLVSSLCSVLSPFVGWWLMIITLPLDASNGKIGNWSITVWV